MVCDDNLWIVPYICLRQSVRSQRRMSRVHQWQFSFYIGQNVLFTFFYFVFMLVTYGAVCALADCHVLHMYIDTYYTW